MAAVAVLTALRLPSRHVSLETAHPDGSVVGVIHVHTNRSDGRSPPDEIAAAAARAGLQFLVFTDHGDGTRAPDPPQYRFGVLCLDAVEISTTEGHYLALDMPRAPYPLGGDARGVVEDVKRLGGFGIVAHPNSPKPELSWRDWDAQFDGIEWLNPDTSWRLKARQPGWAARGRIVTTLLGYPWRAPETIAHLLADTELGVDRWMSFARTRRVVLLSGADAHARLDLTNSEPESSRFSLPFPGYESSFRTFSVHVRPDRPLTGDATRDATTIMQALRRGHAYTAMDGIASPASFEFTAINEHATASAGDLLESGGGPVTLHVRSNAPSPFQTILWQDDKPFATARDEVELTRTVQSPAIYRAEIVSPPEAGSVPWIISNPIYVGVNFPAATNASTATKQSKPIFDGRTSKGWRTETDPTSLAALDIAQTVTGWELRMRYGLSGGASSGQYAAVAVELPDGPGSYDRVSFTARAEGPLRVSVQLQPTGRARGLQRSVYLDETARDYTVRFDEGTPLGSASAPWDAKSIHDILFVVETTHAKPGASGRLWLKNVALER